MARRSIDDEHPAPRRRSPAKTPEERENLLISKSLNLIERQIDEGNVSSQVLAIYARLGSTREKLEQERMQNEIEVLRKKVETMESAVDMKNLMTEALDVFRGYTGQAPVEEDEYYD